MITYAKREDELGRVRGKTLIFVLSELGLFKSWLKAPH